MNTARARVVLRYCVVLLFSLLAMPSCTSTTGTSVQMKPDHFDRIRTLGILVRQQEDFSVRLSREKTTNTSVVFFGLIGAGVEGAVRSSTDREHAAALKNQVEQFKPATRLAESLKRHIEASNKFTRVECISADDAGTKQSALFDATLEITLGEWGLRLCIGQGEVERDRVQAAVELHSRILPGKDMAPIWERSDLHMDGSCHSMNELKSGEALLGALSRVVDRAAGRTANEILFP
jgi:hypothetical protein